ncbi:MAG: DUF3825 domain-containing protein [Cyanobacteria bacterium J06623_4]
MQSLLTSLSRFLPRFLRRFFPSKTRGQRQHRSLQTARPVPTANTDSQQFGQPSSSAAVATPEKAAARPVSAELRQLVYQATCEMDKPRMHAGQFGSLLRQQDASFSYEKYDFTKLIYLLEALPDLVALERVDNPGAAPAYYVQPVVNIHKLLTNTLASFDSPDGWAHIESVEAAIAHQLPSFSPHTYGFSQIRAFLSSRPDLIEFKPDSINYLRLQQASEVTRARPTARRNGARPIIKPAIQRPVLQKPAIQKLGVVRESARDNVKESQTRAAGVGPAGSIIHLSRFAGFSPEILNRKVSQLAAIALPERWYFGPQPPDNFAYPILKSYLRYTFIRLQYERKVLTSLRSQSRAFNTGLLDRLLRPIYALLTPTQVASQPWDLLFCIPGEGPAGKALVAQFTTLPAPANYLSDPSRVFYHLSAGSPDVDWQHIVKDNMERLPASFIAQYAPAGFLPRNTQSLTSPEFHSYKKAFSDALDADLLAYRNLVNRLEEALSRTLLKTQINYKTAVPTYYPNINSIDLLLPICLIEEDVADCAIVTRQSDSGKYIGHTILTMRQAYNNARLICKLDEHWLSRAMTLSQTDFEEEEDDSEEFETTEAATESALNTSASSH